VLDQRSRGAVAAQHRYLEAADAGSAGPLAQRGHERGTDATVLPVVDDLDRHLGRLEVVQAHVPGDPDRRPRRRRERDQRLVVPMVDTHEPYQLAWGEFVLRAEVPLIPGLRAEMRERERDSSAVGRKKLADRDRAGRVLHLTTYNASQAPYVRTSARARVRSVSYTCGTSIWKDA
jgi:hypothetical protein